MSRQEQVGTGAARRRPRVALALHDARVFAHQFARSLRPPVQLVAWTYRRRHWRRDRDRLVAEHFAAPGPRRLHLGCGDNLLPGWLNTDVKIASGVAYVDATASFPFADATFDYVHSEHMIEHVPYESGTAMLREAFRVLRPGGRVRIATPDLRNILALYTDRPSEAQRRYLEWSARRYTPRRGRHAPADVINTFMTSWGHTFVYDEASLSDQFRDVGFADVVRRTPGESDDPNLAAIERHGTAIGSEEMNRLETMVLEARKPG